MLGKIKLDDTKKIAISLFLILLIFMCLQNFGFLPKICNTVEKTLLTVAGYQSKEYVVEDRNKIPIAMMMGVNIEQEIYLTKNIIENEKIMLEIDVANYERINQGQLVLEIHQKDTVKVFVTDMAGIEEDKTIRLITDTSGLKEGNMYVNMYSPEATGENCVAVYSINDTSVYKELVICGELTQRNACIDLSIPSDFAKTDFVQVNVE